MNFIPNEKRLNFCFSPEDLPRMNNTEKHSMREMMNLFHHKSTNCHVINCSGCCISFVQNAMHGYPFSQRFIYIYIFSPYHFHFDIMLTFNPDNEIQYKPLRHSGFFSFVYKSCIIKFNEICGGNLSQTIFGIVPSM